MIRQGRDNGCEAQEHKVISELIRLKKHIDNRRLKKAEKIHQVICLLKGRCPRGPRYYRMKQALNPNAFPPDLR